MTPRETLRDATRDLHDRVEAAVDMAARLDSRDGYAALLSALYGLVAPTEQHLAAMDWSAVGLDLAPHLRAPLLRSDVSALGLDPDRLPLDPDAPRPVTPPAGLGTLYVLEGSALGGQILARAAHERLGLGDDETRYFRSDGRPVGRHWRAFGRTLDATLDTPAALAEAVEAARATFQAFESWVGGHLLPTAP